MNSRWALALPVTRLPKSLSDSDSVTIDSDARVSRRGQSSGSCNVKRPLTIGLALDALGNLARVLQVDRPALRLAATVLKGEGEDGVALLDRILAVGVACVERLVDGVKGGRGGELVCCQGRTAVSLGAPGYILQWSGRTARQRHDCCVDVDV